MYIFLEIYILCFCVVIELLISYIEDIVRFLCWEVEEREVDVYLKLYVIYELRLCVWCVVCYLMLYLNVIYYEYVFVCFISICLFI